MTKPSPRRKTRAKRRPLVDSDHFLHRETKEEAARRIFASASEAYECQISALHAAHGCTMADLTEAQGEIERLKTELETALANLSISDEHAEKLRQEIDRLKSAQTPKPAPFPCITEDDIAASMKRLAAVRDAAPPQEDEDSDPANLDNAISKNTADELPGGIRLDPKPLHPETVSDNAASRAAPFRHDYPQPSREGLRERMHDPSDTPSPTACEYKTPDPWICGWKPPPPQPSIMSRFGDRAMDAAFFVFCLVVFISSIWWGPLLVDAVLKRLQP